MDTPKWSRIYEHRPIPSSNPNHLSKAPGAAESKFIILIIKDGAELVDG